MKFSLGLGKTADAAKDDGFIKDTTTKDFMRDVIEASAKTPVIVDFWAPWCGPCKQLTPILEKVVKAAKGAVRLVKMNIDEHPAIAGQMGVQSIPAVFAFRDGRPVDGFMGMLSEAQVKEFIARIGGAGEAEDAGALLEAANAALGEGEVNAAAQAFAALLKADPENADAAAGLAKCYIALGDLKRAEQTLALILPAKQNAAAALSAKAALELAKKGAKAGDHAALERRLGSNPDDHQARFDLAIALNAKGARAEALAALLEIIRRERSWNEDAARKQLFEFFEAWGHDDPQTMSGRRQLSSILFS